MGALGARLIDLLLQPLFLDAELPVGHHVARVGDGRVGKGLTDYRHRHTTQFAHGPGLEHRVAKIVGLDVLRKKFNLAEFFFDDLLDAVLAVGEFPMAGHEIHAKQFLRRDHVTALRPQGRGRTLPGVATIEQQRRRPGGAQLLYKGGEMGESTDLAVDVGGLGKIEIGEGIGLARTGLETESLEQGIANEVGRAVDTIADPEVNIGFAKICRHQLRVAVGEMQQRDITKARQIVKAAPLLRPGGKRQARGRGQRKKT